MNLADIQTLYDFNYWANHRILEIVEPLTEEQVRKDLGSSHGGIQGTLFHIMGAEAIWLRRWKGESPAGFWKPEDVPTFTALKQRWDMVEMEVLGFCHMLKTDVDIERIFEYKDLKGNSYSSLLSQSMQHVVNHSTYHRGQVVTMIRQSGMKAVSTDLIAYYRLKK